jgi:hypothetical protein
MKITHEENELLLELIREHDFPQLDPARHVTTAMYSDALGVSRRCAYDHLEKLRQAGELVREKVRDEGRRVIYGYYKPEI